MRLSQKSAFALQQYLKDEVKRQVSKQLGAPQRLEASETDESEEQRRKQAVDYLKRSGYSQPQQEQSSERKQKIDYLKRTGYGRGR